MQEWVAEPARRPAWRPSRRLRERSRGASACGGATARSVTALTDADEGTITIGTPSTIGTRTRHQSWVLTQTGNWSENLVDFNDDGDGLDTGELEETRVHNKANELISRDTNSSSPAEFNLVYDEVGNMTSDNENYQYKWDAFGRLREVKNLSNNVVSEYWYNGLGYLTVRLQDTNLDGVANSTDDRKYVTIYDERWRQVATYRVNPSTGALDANPKEQFLYHAAGNGGWGGSSYIDSVILRESVSNSWTAVGASTLSKTLYYCQNWRADVVVLLDVASTVTTLVQNVRYSAYGVPFGIPYGDVDSDGDCDGGDDAQVTSWIGSSTYNVRGDLDLDGDVDSGDLAEVQANEGELGYGALSDRTLRNRKGYAGYEGDSSLSAVWHVRHRVLDSRLGRWLRRDPLEYDDGTSLLALVCSNPILFVDPSGLSSSLSPTLAAVACGVSCPDECPCQNDFNFEVGFGGQGGSSITPSGFKAAFECLENLGTISDVAGAGGVAAGAVEGGANLGRAAGAAVGAVGAAIAPGAASLSNPDGPDIAGELKKLINDHGPQWGQTYIRMTINWCTISSCYYFWEERTCEEWTTPWFKVNFDFRMPGGTTDFMGDLVPGSFRGETGGRNESTREGTILKKAKSMWKDFTGEDV